MPETDRLEPWDRPDGALLWSRKLDLLFESMLAIELLLALLCLEPLNLFSFERDLSRTAFLPFLTDLIMHTAIKLSSGTSNFNRGSYSFLTYYFSEDAKSFPGKL
jgi:hypothetical protein